MQAIITEFRGFTNKLPSRIVAKTGNGQNKLTFSLTHAVGTEAQNHARAAKIMQENMNWQGKLILARSIRNGYVFVIEDPSFQ